MGELSPPLNPVERRGITRRQAMRNFALWLAASPLLEAADKAPKLIGEPPGRITPPDELVNVFEAEAMAKRSLPEALFAKIKGTRHEPFDRITLQPRMLEPTRNMDLTVELFGTRLFAPILAGPASRVERFHPGGETALVRGAASTKTLAVISANSSQPLATLAREATSGAWYQVYPAADMAPVLSQVTPAEQAGYSALCVTVGTPYQPAGFEGPPDPAHLAVLGRPAMDWSVLDQLRQAAKLPVVLKGIMSPEEAQTAVDHGIDGIVVSNHGGRFLTGLAAPIEVLPGIVDAVGAKIPVLMDSDIRRGTDIVKALALGARAVLVTRPVLWGLAAYGEEGAKTVLEMLQGETARNMALCGKRTLAELDRTLVRIDRN
jgi:isopentenyl diphosphate isomerase/L-lactate dehydrogenase-like FMN-dependent dehydrogenase